MKINEAIKKAIEGGWPAFQHCSPTCPELAVPEVSMDGKVVIFHEDTTFADNAHDQVAYSTSEVFLDPLFWQSLGKAMGWNDSFGSVGITYTFTFANPKLRSVAHWLYYWHRFIDYLAEGKTADSFFQSLN